MASTDLEKKAKEAFVDDNFELAVDLYTQALDLDPKSADLYADRAQANIKLGSFTEAVADANKAIELDSSMVKAYLRKGIGWALLRLAFELVDLICLIKDFNNNGAVQFNLEATYEEHCILHFNLHWTACYHLLSLKMLFCWSEILEEYQTAKVALTTGLSLAPGDSRFNRLIKECDERIAEETKDISKAALPNSSESSTSASDVNVERTINGQPKHDVGYHSQDIVKSKPKFRQDFYNTTMELVLTIFAKGIPPENVHIEFGEQILSLSIDIPGADSFHFQPRLFGKIIPEECKYFVLPTKIEIRLVKAEAVPWPSLEYKKDQALPQKIIVQSEIKNQRPSYPSSKSKIEWDKLEAEVKKEEKEEKLDGDAALNKLFRDIYQNADEDMKRAMCKSFVESNGTVLSTNWKDVGSKKVDGSPPDGMEMKKW